MRNDEDNHDLHRCLENTGLKTQWEGQGRVIMKERLTTAHKGKQVLSKCPRGGRGGGVSARFPVCRLGAARWGLRTHTRGSWGHWPCPLPTPGSPNGDCAYKSVPPKPSLLGHVSCALRPAAALLPGWDSPSQAAGQALLRRVPGPGRGWGGWGVRQEAAVLLSTREVGGWGPRPSAFRLHLRPGRSTCPWTAARQS